MPDPEQPVDKPKGAQSPDVNYPLTGGDTGSVTPEITPEDNGSAAKEAEVIEIGEDEPEKSVRGGKPGKIRRLKRWYGERKKWTIPATVVLLLAIIAAIPWTRYLAAGTVLKQNLAIEVTDSKTNSPVSGAAVAIGSVSGTTNGSGDIILYGVKVGHRRISISKKYYQDQQLDVLVPILSPKGNFKIALVATGRQVKISVKDTISGQPLDSVSIKAAGSEAKTDSDGTAVIVVPADSVSETAALSLNGYNSASVKIKVSAEKVQENDFTLTPVGKVYFLSRRSGKLNLMKANMDGTKQEVVLAGTGLERDEASGISMSGDGNYVTLLLKRSTSDSGPQLYVMSTADDKLIGIDSGNNTYYVYGWAGDHLIYEDDSNTMQPSDTGAEKLKSYNAATGKTILLDQTIGAVDKNGKASYNNYVQIFVTPDTVVFGKDWTFEGNVLAKQNTVNTISPEGQNHQVVKSFDTQKFDFTAYAQHGPKEIYVDAGSYYGTTSDKYFDYTIGGQLSPISLTDSQFYRNYPSYYLSPSGDKVLWTETRDGKNTFLVGDSGGNNSKAVATLDGYKPYGWLTDKYILLSKSSSQLYIMSANGSGKPVKITDYQSTGGI